jgi:hypothetical protein
MISLSISNLKFSVDGYGNADVTDSEVAEELMLYSRVFAAGALTRISRMVFLYWLAAKLGALRANRGRCRQSAGVQFIANGHGDK